MPAGPAVPGSCPPTSSGPPSAGRAPLAGARRDDRRAAHRRRRAGADQPVLPRWDPGSPRLPRRRAARRRARPRRRRVLGRTDGEGRPRSRWASSCRSRCWSPRPSPGDGVRGGVGDRTSSRRPPTACRHVLPRGFGDVRLDLGRIDVSDLDGPVRTRVDAGVGDVDVVVPRDADVQVDIDAGLGERQPVRGAACSDGGFFPGRGAGSWVGDDDPEIVLTIDAGVGDLEVSRGLTTASSPRPRPAGRSGSWPTGRPCAPLATEDPDRSARRSVDTGRPRLRRRVQCAGDRADDRVSTSRSACSATAASSGWS